MPRGVEEDSKRDRQYEHIKQSYIERGKSEAEAEEIAARTINEIREEHHETRPPWTEKGEEERG